MKASHHSYAHSEPPFGQALLLLILFVLVPLALAAAAYGAPVSPKPDLLAGPAPGPCRALTAQADYAGGTDASGHPVVPAEGPAAAPPIQVPGETVLVRENGVEIPVEIKGLNKGMAAGEACAAHDTRARSLQPRP